MDEEMAADALAKRWSLGKNGVVRKAAHALAKNCSEAWMVALVPDTKANAHAFFQATLSTPPPGLTDWEYANFGYLTWEEFEAHCRANAAEWPETLANFEFNRGQIFGLHEAAEPPRPRTVVTWNSPSGPQQVTIKNRHKHNTRVYLSEGTRKEFRIGISNGRSPEDHVGPSIPRAVLTIRINRYVKKTSETLRIVHRHLN